MAVPFLVSLNARHNGTALTVPISNDEAMTITDDDADELDEDDPDYLSEEEFDLYNEIENSAEMEKLNRVIEQYQLRDYLDEAEMQVLVDFWCATNVADFMIDAGSFMAGNTNDTMGSIHERSTRLAEKQFIAAKEKMFETPGWMLLDPTIQREIFEELFTMRFGGK